MGNAFAVTVTTRLLFALTLALSVPGSGALALWSDPSLPAPFHHDCLDDLLEPIHKISSDYSFLVEDFDASLPLGWSDQLIGPDPGAVGRRNRSQRAAAVGSQLGTQMSRNGLPMLIPEDNHSPERYNSNTHSVCPQTSHWISSMQRSARPKTAGVQR